MEAVAFQICPITIDGSVAVTLAGRFVRITHRPSNTVLAEGPLGWGITPFEGNFYIRRKYLRSGTFRANFIPGLCVYKFFYVWLNLELPSGDQEPSLAWLYWLPNPLLPFIWYRVALPGNHPNLEVQLWRDGIIFSDLRSRIANRTG